MDDADRWETQLAVLQRQHIIGHSTGRETHDIKKHGRVEWTIIAKQKQSDPEAEPEIANSVRLFV
jgi:hypothetical protein